MLYDDSRDLRGDSTALEIQIVKDRQEALGNSQ
jgi:hypothetical protein